MKRKLLASISQRPGLAIARRIVKVHVGRIWAESESDKGSVFWIALSDSAIVNRDPGAISEQFHKENTGNLHGE